MKVPVMLPEDQVRHARAQEVLRERPEVKAMATFLHNLAPDAPPKGPAPLFGIMAVELLDPVKRQELMDLLRTLDRPN